MRAGDYPFFDAPFLAFAHRGGASYPPNLRRENTLHAFTEATRLGYHYLETDVHTSADGMLFAFHDPVLDRVTDRTGRIGELHSAEVARARIGGVDPIPTLAELFSAFPDARFNVDVKAENAVDPLAKVIADHEAWDRVCVGSFGIGRLHRLRRRLGPRVPSAASVAGVAYTRFLPWFTRALNTPGAALQVPESQLIRNRRLQVLTPRLLEAAHRAGKQVHVWTVDDAETMTRLIDAGVDGIFTDRVDTLKEVLEQRGLWT